MENVIYNFLSPTDTQAIFVSCRVWMHIHLVRAEARTLLDTANFNCRKVCPSIMCPPPILHLPSPGGYLRIEVYIGLARHA